MEKKHHRRISSHWKPPSVPISHHLSFHSFNSSTEREVRPNVRERCQRYNLANFRKYRGNEICTAKYNVVTFIPKNLYEQFHRFANIYFLIIVGLEWIPIFSAYDPMISTLPPVIILTLTAIKDLIEDLRRRKLDSQVNNTSCHVYDGEAGRFRRMLWQHVLVGDIVHISNEEFVPADLLLLRSSDESGNAFMETATLDGESNLKHRLVSPSFLLFCGEHSVKYDSEGIPHIFETKIECEAPSKDVAKMNGYIEWNGTREAFSSSNTLLRGCRLRNTTFVEGIVLYAGADTKLMLNNGRAPYKRSSLERRTNLFVLLCSLCLLLIVGISVLLHSFFINSVQESAPFIVEFESGEVAASVATFLIQYQMMIPLPLYITVEIIKMGHAYLMTQDMEMFCEVKEEGAVCRSLTIGEELGQLTHLLSDKTGTLTENSMLFRVCSTLRTNFSTEIDNFSCPTSDPDWEALLLNMAACNSVFVHSQRCDAIEIGDIQNGVFTIGNSFFFDYTEEDYERLAIEHEKKAENAERILEGESPDELALVRGAGLLGIQLISRGSNSLQFRMPDGTIRMLKVVCALPFDSTRKRMSVVIEEENEEGEEERVIIFTKGADSAMFHGDAHTPVSEGRLGVIDEVEEECESVNEDELRSRVDSFARLGLRTLVHGVFSMPREEFDEWRERYKFVETVSKSERGSLLADICTELERKTRVIGVTAVEDKLQEGVASTLSLLRSAGISVWVLTGDKRETAEGVARSCGLFHPLQLPSRIDRPEQIPADDIGAFHGKDVVVSPEVVSALTEPHNQHIIAALKCCRSVLCYRMTPSQKAEIVRSLKHSSTRSNPIRVAAVGDGANDVPMIQAANVGIGITGKEGTQAAVAADYVLARFSFVSRLIVLHGHWNYARLSSSLLYFFMKNSMSVFITALAQISNGFTAEYPIDPIYSMLYPVIFTSLQPLLFGMLDQDVSEAELLSSPHLYQSGATSSLYTLSHFALNMLDAFWQAATVYFVCQGVFDDSPDSRVYFGLCLATGMFLTNNVHLALETKCWTWFLVATHGLCLAVHFVYFCLVSHFVQPSWTFIKDPPVGVAEDSFEDPTFWLIMSLIVVIAIFPRFAVRVLTSRQTERRRLHSIVETQVQNQKAKTSSASFCVDRPVTATHDSPLFNDNNNLYTAVPF